MGKDSKKHKKEKRHKHYKDKHRSGRSDKSSADKDRVKAALAAIDIRACRIRANASVRLR